MPTLVWVRRPKSGTDAAAREGSATSTRREAAVPDSVVSAAAAAVLGGAAISATSGVSDPVALPAVSSKRHIPADGGKKKKRKANRAKAVTAAKKMSKAKPERDLPKGVQKSLSGKFNARIRWGGKLRGIGTFDTPEQASAAHMSVKKDRDDVELSALGADEVDTLFDAAKQKAVKAEGGFFTRDLPKGVYGHKKLPGKFQSQIHWCGKTRGIGTFDTPEQASVAFMSVRKDLDDAKLSGFGADEVHDIFDAAKKKALETVQAMMDSDEYGDENLV